MVHKTIKYRKHHWKYREWIIVKNTWSLCTPRHVYLIYKTRQDYWDGNNTSTHNDLKTAKAFIDDLIG